MDGQLTVTDFRNEFFSAAPPQGEQGCTIFKALLLGSLALPGQDKSSYDHQVVPVVEVEELAAEDDTEINPVNPDILNKSGLATANTAETDVSNSITTLDTKSDPSSLVAKAPNEQLSLQIVPITVTKEDTLESTTAQPHDTVYQDASLESATSNVINQQNWTTYVASKLAIDLETASLLNSLESDSLSCKLRNGWHLPLWGALGVVYGERQEDEIRFRHIELLSVIHIDDYLSWHDSVSSSPSASIEDLRLLSVNEECRETDSFDNRITQLFESLRLESSSHKVPLAWVLASAGFGISLPKFVCRWATQTVEHIEKPFWAGLCLAVDVEVSYLPKTIYCEVYNVQDKDCPALDFEEIL